MAAFLDYKKVAKTNPAVDAAKIEQAIAYRDIISKAGVSIKPTYRISPPLGPSRAKPKPSHALATRKTRAF